MPKLQTLSKTFVGVGETYTYAQIHQWVKLCYGTATKCDNPDCKKKSTYYQWSNISREYLRERHDWQMLCRSCHATYDMTSFCKIASANRLKGNTYKRKIVYQFSVAGEFIKEWPSVTSVGAELGISHSSICNHIKGTTKTAGGYKWSYTNKVS